LNFFKKNTGFKFPSILGADMMDCGPTSLRIIAKYYGRNHSLESLRKKSFTNREGSSLSQLAAAAESIGFRSLSAKINFQQRTASLHCSLEAKPLCSGV
jgi:ATP-binding cassette, subfamily B, bacterial